jgi:Methyltransferase domain
MARNNRSSSHNHRGGGVVPPHVVTIVALILAGAICTLVTTLRLSSLSFAALSTTASTSTSSIDSNTNTNNAYTAALFTLRCLTTPGCFRSMQCRTGVPQRIQRKKVWEEQALCVDDLRLQQNSCLVYSFGIHTSWEWEEKVARLFGCDVHAFDPTMNHPSQLAPGVTFHKLGLQATGTNMSATHSDLYSPIDVDKLLSLEQIMTRLGHDNRKLSVLMLDCEGCEWGVLRQFMCSKNNYSVMASVDQIVVEMHFQKNLGLLNEADVLGAAQAVVCLEQARWSITSIEKSGIDKEDADYARDVTKVLHGTEGAFLLNLALQRIPDDQPLPSERIESIAGLSKPWFRAQTACAESKDENSATCLEYRRLDREFTSEIGEYQSVTKNRAQFDTHPRLNESTWKY